jgi:hypothetical protein
VYIIELLKLGIVEIRSFDPESAEEFDRVYVSYEDLRVRVRDRALSALEARLGSTAGSINNSGSNTDGQNSSTTPSLDSPSRRLRAPAPSPSSRPTTQRPPPPSCSSPFALSARDMLLRDIEDKLIGQYVIARASIANTSRVNSTGAIISEAVSSRRILQLTSLPGDARVSTGTSFPALVPKPDGESDFEIPLAGRKPRDSVDASTEGKSRTSSFESAGAPGVRGRSFGELVHDLFVSPNDAPNSSSASASTTTSTSNKSYSPRVDPPVTPVKKGDKFNRAPGGATVSRNGAAVKARMAQDALEFVQNLLQSYSGAEEPSDVPPIPVSLGHLKERRHSRGSLSDSSLTSLPGNLRGLLTRSYSSGCETPENMRRASRKALYEDNDLGNSMKSTPVKSVDVVAGSAESSPRNFSDDPTHSTLSLASFVGSSEDIPGPL